MSTEAASRPGQTAEVASSTTPALSDDDLLLFAVELDQLTLTETLAGHGDPSDPLLPIGELSRLLELDIDVFPSERRITGNLGQARKSVLIDLKTGVARVGGTDVILKPGDVAVTQSDIFVRASVLQHIFPIKFDVRPEELAIKLTALAKLPIEERLDRIARMRGLGSGAQSAGEASLKIKSPYELYSAPAFDVAVQGGRDTRTLQTYSGRYDVRFAGDLLYTDLQGYVGSDDQGRPNSARILLERRSSEGALPLGITRISGGDVFTPALAMGPRSVGGRGVSLSTVPLEQTSVFNTIDLRGELPIGYDVELYVNDVLRSGQRSPVQGRYEFLSVPLVRGINIIRIVTYGPRGERDQIVRVVNVGGGQVPKGESQFEFAAVQQGRAVIEPRALGRDELTLDDANGPRVVASAAYGLTDGITIVGGAALYPTGSTGQRNIATVGLRTPLAGFALQVDGAADTSGGDGIAVGLAGQPLGVSMLLKHSEYRGGFVDETITSLDIDRPPVRHTSLTADLSLPSFGGKRLPLSFRALRDGFRDGGTSYVGSARTSATVLDTLVSTGVDFEQTTRPDSARVRRLVGNLSASKFLNFKWQLRASADYELLPTGTLSALSFTADRSVSDDLALRFGLGKSLGEARDTFGQAGAVLRLPFAELSLSGDYSVRNQDWGVSMRLGFGSLFDPSRQRYVLTRPGAASGANAIFHAFLDRDGDGRFTAGDEPISNVSLEGGQRPIKTGANGSAVVTGLGSGPTAAIRISTKDIDQFYVGSAPTRVEFAPRPGQVIDVQYPVEPVGEVYARLFTKPLEGPPVGLSAVQVRLVREGLEPINGTTEYDGSVVFSDVPLGLYRLELNPEQAGRLGMKFERPVTLVVKPDTDAQIQATIVFSRSGNQTDQSREVAKETHS